METNAEQVVMTQHGPQPAPTLVDPWREPQTLEEAMVALNRYRESCLRMDAAVRRVLPDAAPPFGYYAVTVLEGMVLDLCEKVAPSEEG